MSLRAALSTAQNSAVQVPLPAPPPALANLQRRDRSLALWHRAIPPFVSNALAVWARSAPPAEEHTVHPPLPPLRLALPGLSRAVRAWLEEDVHSLLQVLFGVANPHAAALRFGVVESDQCRKFHVDYLRYRLITTYLGPGTEWVPNEHVERSVLLEPPEDPELANALLVKHFNAVRHAEAGDVLLMKGAKHEHGLGLLHRSPPIEHSGTLRVVLVVSTRESCPSRQVR